MRIKGDRLIVVIAGFLVLLIALIAISDWAYLSRGYSIAVGIEGRQPKTFHIDFPSVRRVVHVLLWGAALVATYLFATGYKHARFVSWSVFVAGLMIGLWDIILYGSMGTPTSMVGVLLLLLIALTTQFRSRLPRMI